MKFIASALTSLIITAPLGLTFPVDAQVPKIIRNSASFDELIRVNEQKTLLIALQPDQSLAFLSLGNSRFGLGDYVGAIAAYNQALQINPDNAAAYYNRGEVRSKLGDKKRAIADLKKAIHIFQSQGEQNSYQDALNDLKKIQNLPKQSNHK
jgi:tetratricopeptide (TPR) repeat protein